MATPKDAEETRPERQEETKETGRLEAFSDGVFAIAITLLILNVQVPSPLHTQHQEAWDDFVRLWPSYLAYVLSFVTILIMWANHHLIFRLIQRTNQLFLMLNGLLLMFITFLNFPTALVAASIKLGDAAIATLIYNGTLIVISVLFNIVWRYATYNGRLLDPRADPKLVQTIHRQYRVGPFVYVVPFLLALPFYPLAIGIDLALAVYFSLTGSVHLFRSRKSDAGYDPEKTPVLPG